MRADYHTHTENDARLYARAHDDGGYRDTPDPGDTLESDWTNRPLTPLPICDDCGEQYAVACRECWGRHCVTLACMPDECRDDEMRSALADEARMYAKEAGL